MGVKRRGNHLREVRCRTASSSIDEFRFEVAENAPSHIVSSFTDWLSEYIADGASFSNDETLQFGYAIFSCQVQSRTLSLLAPDFKSMPIAWVPDLGPAFEIIAAHKYTPETFGFEPDIPSLLNYALVGDRFDELPMFADRTSTEGSNPDYSGWFIGSQRDDIDNTDPESLRPMSLYQIVLSVPQVLPYLSLPAGCQVRFDEGNPTFFKDESELEIPRGSYLDRLFRS